MKRDSVQGSKYKPIVPTLRDFSKTALATQAVSTAHERYFDITITCALLVLITFVFVITSVFVANATEWQPRILSRIKDSALQDRIPIFCKSMEGSLAYVFGKKVISVNSDGNANEMFAAGELLDVSSLFCSKDGGLVAVRSLDALKLYIYSRGRLSRYSFALRDGIAKAEYGPVAFSLSGESVALHDKPVLESGYDVLHEKNVIQTSFQQLIWDHNNLFSFSDRYIFRYEQRSSSFEKIVNIFQGEKKTKNVETLNMRAKFCDHRLYVSYLVNDRYTKTDIYQLRPIASKLDVFFGDVIGSDDQCLLVLEPGRPHRSGAKEYKAEGGYETNPPQAFKLLGADISDNRSMFAVNPKDAALANVIQLSADGCCMLVAQFIEGMKVWLILDIPR